MRTHNKPHDEHSPLAILTELAVEGTSSMVEAQRTLLDLAQQENDIILNGVKERIGGFAPAVAITDLVRRSLDTLIGMQQELLTTTSKQTLHLLEPGPGTTTSPMVEFVREGVESFTRAQKKFLDLVAEETARATSGKPEHDGKNLKKTELNRLAREAGSAFIEAQKRLLDVMGQQMNVNLDVATRSLGMMSPSRLIPMAKLTGADVRNLVDRETSLIGSLIKPPKKVVGRAKHGKRHATRRSKAVPV